MNEIEAAALIEATVTRTLASLGLTATPAAPVARIDVLTETERAVLALICEGKNNTQIGDVLMCSMETVKNHVTAMLNKLALQLGEHPNRTSLAYWAGKAGL